MASGMMASATRLGGDDSWDDRWKKTGEGERVAAVVAEGTGGEPVDTDEGWDDDEEGEGGVHHLFGVMTKEPEDEKGDGADEQKGDDESPDDILQERGRGGGKGEGVEVGGGEDAGKGGSIEDEGGGTGGGRVAASDGDKEKGDGREGEEEEEEGGEVAEGGAYWSEIGGYWSLSSLASDGRAAGTVEERRGWVELRS